MKKLILLLICMSLSISTFAIDGKFNSIDSEDVYLNSEGVVYDTFVGVSNSQNNYMLFADCTITIKDNQTGKSYTITVHDQSCADLIKELMKKKWFYHESCGIAKLAKKKYVFRTVL